MLNRNPFSFENPFLQSVRWRLTGTTASFLLCECSISLYHRRNRGIFRTELIIPNLEERKGSLGGSLSCFFLISETGLLTAHLSIRLRPYSILVLFSVFLLISVEESAKNQTRTFYHIYIDFFLNVVLKNLFLSAKSMLLVADWLSLVVVMDFLNSLIVLFMTDRVCKLLNVLQKTVLKVINGYC